MHILAQMKQPIAVLPGEHDGLDPMAMPTLWRGAVKDIPGAAHTPQWEMPHFSTTC
jgi:hypothetical protein